MTHSAPKIFARVGAFLVAAFLLVLAPSLAQAAVTPNTGPTAGGTSVSVGGLTFVQISSGEQHSLGLMSDGSVWAWGNNSNGQLGIGPGVNSSNIPRRVLGVGGTGYLTGVKQIAAGYVHSLALTDNGEVLGWGSDSHGNLGQGSNLSRNVPIFVKGIGGSGTLSGIVSISAGYEHSLAATSAGEALAWGWNWMGEIGVGNTTDVNLPTKVLGLGGNGYLAGVTKVAAGWLSSYALGNGGSVYSWGWNGANQLGDGTSSWNTLTPVQVLGMGGTGLLGGVTSLSAGYGHVLATVTGSTGLIGWGSNAYGQLGQGAIVSNYSSPVQIKGIGGSGLLLDVTDFYAGYDHSLAATSSGVVTWGKNGDSQLGNGNTTDGLSPALVSLSGPSSIITHVAGGRYSSIATNGSQIFSWGKNDLGQAGDGTNSNRSTPVLGANIQPASMTFGSTAGSSLTASGLNWSVTSPAGNPGSVTLTGAANMFGGTTAASPSSLTWNAGTFTYQDPVVATASTNPGLAATGTKVNGDVIGLGAVLLVAGATLALWRRRLG